MSKTYTTKSGDMWDLIAYNELGSCDYVTQLINANRKYANVAIFSAGVVLNLPTIDESKLAKNLPPWKR